MSGLIPFALAAMALSSGSGGQSPLPAPTGMYRVGTRVLASQVDRSRLDDRFASGARTVAVQLWYPTGATAGNRSPYVPDPMLLDALKAGSSAPEIVETWRTLRTHAVLDAPPAGGAYPLVLFSHGFGMSRSYYTAWIEELVSQGFVVAAFDHPFAGTARIDGRVFPQTPHPDGPGGQVVEMTADLRFVLPMLIARAGVDGSRVAAIGHSLGGAAALEACRLDARVAACVDLDGAPFGEFASVGVGRPFMVVHQQPVFPDAKPDGELARLGREIDAEWRGIIAKQQAPVMRLSVRGTGHLSFSDAPFVRPALVEEGGGILTDPTLVLRKTTAVVAAYLRNMFSGSPNAALPMPDFIGPARLGTDWVPR